jgi:hypothetical protein
VKGWRRPELGLFAGTRSLLMRSAEALCHQPQLEQTMKKFLAIYIGTAAAMEKSEWNRMDEGKRKEREAAGMKAWGEWMERNKASIVESGGPLGKTKSTSKQGVSDTKNTMTGYVTVQAGTHEAAAKMFQDHPFFTIFPGEAVEVMEVLPIPGQR